MLSHLKIFKMISYHITTEAVCCSYYPSPGVGEEDSGDGGNGCGGDGDGCGGDGAGDGSDGSLVDEGARALHELAAVLGDLDVHQPGPVQVLGPIGVLGVRVVRAGTWERSLSMEGSSLASAIPVMWLPQGQSPTGGRGGMAVVSGGKVGGVVEGVASEGGTGGGGTVTSFPVSLEGLGGVHNR